MPLVLGYWDIRGVSVSGRTKCGGVNGNTTSGLEADFDKIEV